VMGCIITDYVSRKGGEAGLKGRVSETRLAYVQKQVEKRGAIMLAVASLMPPPFPFTVFVMVSAALNYPRLKLLGIIATARLARFVIEGWLAIHYGRHLIEISKAPAFEGVVLTLVAICIGGSVWSIVTWIHKSAFARRRT
jgi:membrane protein YqaA with SNARE-associated domain